MTPTACARDRDLPAGHGVGPCLRRGHRPRPDRRPRLTDRVCCPQHGVVPRRKTGTAVRDATAPRRPRPGDRAPGSSPAAAGFCAIPCGVSGAAGVIVLLVGLGVVVFAADLFVDGLLGIALATGDRARSCSRSRCPGFETENLAAGIAANAKGLPGAAAGTFLGGVTFLSFGVAGLGGLIAPIRVELPTRFAVWTAISPLPLFAFAVDGHISRVEGGVLVIWSVVALVGLALSGRDLLVDDDEDEHVRRPGLRLLVGLALLTGGGYLIGQGLRTTVERLGVPKRCSVTPRWRLRSRPRNSPASPSRRVADGPRSGSAASPGRSFTSRRSTPASSRSSNR